MRTAHVITAAILAATLAGAAPASAQTADRERIRIHVDAGLQVSATVFETTATRLVYLETATIDASYKVAPGLAGDAGVSVRIAGPVSVGVTVSDFTETHDAGVSASLPHPFFFRAPRTITGTAGGLRRDELAAHLQAIYTIRPAAKLDIALAAGPSFFRVQQGVVTDVAFGDTYPYDAPTFTAASSQRVSARKAGFNVGADVGVRLSRHAGVGGGVRYSHATVSLAGPDGSAVSVDAGGLQAVGGLRLYF